MSWPVASFLVLAVVLGVGWIAYERSQPSARMVAVVAVMAAIASLGRDAFAALPDVKPITAITLVVGYSLGPLPGFTVGAVGMLVSNLMFGEGTYTPWQMAAWGMVGLTGGALGALSSRRLGRLSLAFGCGVTALAAKEVMNLYTWTWGASHTVAAFVIIAGQGLPFDITDTIASFVFGLVFGPELAVMLARVRMRMEVTWSPAPLVDGVHVQTSTLRHAPSGAAHPPTAVSAADAGPPTSNERPPSLAPAAPALTPMPLLEEAT